MNKIFTGDLYGSFIFKFILRLLFEFIFLIFGMFVV